MAARRLLVLMLVVLAISTVGAALLAPRPEPAPDAATMTAEESTSPGTARQAPGRLVDASVETGAQRAEAIRLRPGDQLELTVRSQITGQIEIVRFGALEDVGPNEPAHFSLLLGEPGRFAVRLVGSGRIVARVEVSAHGKPPRGASGSDQGRERRRTAREADRLSG